MSNSTSNIQIVRRDPKLEYEFETIERKGIGHPDSIADELASRISREYSRYTYKHCNSMVLHHQIDKLMIIGGQTSVDFGGGYFVNPIEIIVAGRASYSYCGAEIDVDKIIHSVIKDYFFTMFPLVDFENDVVICNRLTSYAGPGTVTSSKGSIANMFQPVSKHAVRGYEELVANDTSYCVAYAPLSVLEESILDFEKNSLVVMRTEKWNWLGTDTKIMAHRSNGEVDMTICVPQIAKYVDSVEAYKDNLKQFEEYTYDYFRHKLGSDTFKLSLNTKDNPATENYYLTVSGASLSGDIGVVGRGNRVNGLITSHRPMSMEGTNGKNPRYYTGFVYAMLTQAISSQTYKEFNKPNICEAISQNGAPLKQPWKLLLISDVNEKQAIDIIHNELENIDTMVDKFMQNKLPTAH